MLSTNEVEKKRISGQKYVLEDDSTLFVFPGFAYMVSTVGTSSNDYVYSVSPTEVSELIEGNGQSVEQTVYDDSTRLYVSKDFYGGLGAVDFLINDTVYSYAETVSVQDRLEPLYDDETESEAEYIRLENSWSNVDDVCIPKREFESRVENGDVLRLWPVWESAHR